MAGVFGHRYVTVKTVGPSRPSALDEAPRNFYQAVGFERVSERLTQFGHISDVQGALAALVIAGVSRP